MAVLLANTIDEAEMVNYSYNLLVDSNYQYTCFMKMYVDLSNMKYQKDIFAYLTCCGYKNIFIIPRFYKLEISFSVELGENVSESNIKFLILDVYDDFIYILNVLNNEKKILRHYPSFLNIFYQESDIN